MSVAEQRYLAVLALIEDGVPVTVVAEKYGVSRQMVHSWQSRYPWAQALSGAFTTCGRGVRALSIGEAHESPTHHLVPLASAAAAACLGGS
jgi:hypothetical protein